MAVLPIVITGDPVLHAPAREIDEIDERIRGLAADMVDTMLAAPGVGLAGPQVGEPLRLFVWRWEDEDGELHEGTAINPELWLSPPAIGPLDEETESEGCLSIPGERFPLRRSERALLRATGLDGERFEIEASGWLARIFQHEFDHLDGVLYADRLAHPHSKDVVKAIKKRSWGSPGRRWLPGVDDLEG